MLTSTWITVVMALMRYMGICHPFSSRKIDGPIFSKVVYATVFVVCVISNLPSFFMFKTVAVNHGTKALYIIDIGVIDQSSPVGQAFIWGKALFGIFVPMAILSFCNLLLIRVLRKSLRMRQQFRVQQTVSSTSNRITLTLIVIMMAFLILVFPSKIMDLVHDHICHGNTCNLCAPVVLLGPSGPWLRYPMTWFNTRDWHRRLYTNDGCRDLTCSCLLSGLPFKEGSGLWTCSCLLFRYTFQRMIGILHFSFYPNRNDFPAQPNNCSINFFTGSHR